MFKIYVFVVLVPCFTFSEYALTCVTPNGEEALCTPLRSCPILQKAYCSGDPTLATFVEASSCGNGKFNVCCGTSRNFTRIEIESVEDTEAKKKYALTNLLPNTTFCGLQHWDDYFHKDHDVLVSLDEFPWLLEFQRPEELTLCSAVLISSRYALTLKKCIKFQDVQVVVGQHDQNKAISCIDTDIGVQDCTDPTLKIDIEEKIQYLDSQLILIRLAETIMFTDYVRPICLPIKNFSVPKIGDIVYTSGWGTYWPYRETMRNTKLKYRFTIGGYNGCGIFNCSNIVMKSPFYISYDKKDLHLYHQHIPVPVMYKSANMNWFLAGLVIRVRFYGDDPSAYAEQVTSEVVDWILENMHE